MRIPIFLDHHSTTPVDPAALEAMLPYFDEHFGNASSRTHAYGWKALEAVEEARAQVATILGAQPKEIIFTSGATESNNLAILGLARRERARGAAAGRGRDHLITTRVEHHAVLDPFRELEREGFRVTYLAPDGQGRIEAAQVEEAIGETTLLVSVMAANNEVGTLYPLREIGEVCRRHGAVFHSDAAQAVGRIPIEVDAAGLDLVSVSAHKLYGPKGIGALFVRGRPSRRIQIAPLLHGGGHERGLRSGTLNVPAIVGFGAACRVARQVMPEAEARILALRERLHLGLSSQLDGVTLNGHPSQRLAGNLNLSFAGVAGEALLMELRELAVSSGSACTSQAPEPSYVLRAMGVKAELAHASLRFGLGRSTSEAEVDFAIDRVVTTVRRLRTMAASIGARAKDPSP